MSPATLRNKHTTDNGLNMTAQTGK